MARKIPAHPDDVRAGLDEAGQRLAEARREHQAAILDIADWLRQGRAAGVEMAEMAARAGITRRTAYKLLGGEPN
jgi:transcriptional regulator GlxA family with amidase domain